MVALTMGGLRRIRSGCRTYLGLITQEFERDRVWDLEWQKFDVKGGLVKLKIYPHVLHDGSVQASINPLTQGAASSAQMLSRMRRPPLCYEMKQLIDQHAPVLQLDSFLTCQTMVVLRLCEV